MMMKLERNTMAPRIFFKISAVSDRRSTTASAKLNAIVIMISHKNIDEINDRSPVAFEGVILILCLKIWPYPLDGSATITSR